MGHKGLPETSKRRSRLNMLMMVRLSLCIFCGHSQKETASKTYVAYQVSAIREKA